MKYFVRTTLDRTISDSYKQIEYELLIDKDYKPIESFINQLKIISDFDSVLLEDDCILCNNFKEEIEKVIAEHPNDIINFFCEPTRYFTSHYTETFYWNQCTYYPKGVSKLIAEKMEILYKDNPKRWMQYDRLESMALNELGLIHFVYRPCLIQHIDFFSLIQKNEINCRRSPYFIDYLKALNISYTEAYKKDNIKALKQYMNNYFKNYEPRK